MGQYNVSLTRVELVELKIKCKSACIRRGITQCELAAMVGLPHQRISEMFHGRYQKVEALLKVSNMLGERDLFSPIIDKKLAS